MAPPTPLPYDASFTSPDDYINSLLQFTRKSDTFQILCGGMHILDFFTSETSLFQAALPQEWQPFLLSTDIMSLLDLLVRDSTAGEATASGQYGSLEPPDSLMNYVKEVRRLSLRRDFRPRKDVPPLPRSVSVGMKPKKVHEVRNFADYVERLSESIERDTGTRMTHFVDFGSGQNYLGRTLASEPYNRDIVAVEGRENNVTAARQYDIHSGLTVKPRVMRNKKLWNRILEACGPDGQGDPEALEKAIRQVAGDDAFDFRPVGKLETETELGGAEGKGHVQYVSARLDSGDLSQVVADIKLRPSSATKHNSALNLMAVSIHSCGNLSHHGIRSLILNPDIKAVAIVGCCYNLLTERLGPPSYKHPYLRPTLQALNGRLIRESEKRDPHGFPISERLATYEGEGVRFNITARMMACQAPQNWNRADSEGFFQRHFYRASLQKIFLDRGVVGKIRHQEPPQEGSSEAELPPETPFNVSTNPVIIGSLGKKCYSSFRAYVHGVVAKLTTNVEFQQYAEVMRDKMAGITDEEMERYERELGPRKHEVAVIWTLMAFSAMLVESLIVTDRWLYLTEQGDVVKEAWAETVFDFAESPRNMVVVGIKR